MHNRVPWGPSYVNRSSQHVFLSSQTLQDLCRTIPCISNNLPTEAGFESEILTDDEGSRSAIYIEGLVYGDENSNKGCAEYALFSLYHLARTNIHFSKLMSQIEVLKKKPSFSVAKAPTSLKQTTFSSLSIRLNEPYWLIHQGNCEHFIVVNQIRYVVPMCNLVFTRYMMSSIGFCILPMPSLVIH